MSPTCSFEKPLPSGNLDFFIIAGPTAVGKSGIAVGFAELCGGEIVGADAFQVYAGLELLTAKPSAELRARVPHHLIGEIPLTEPFDVGRYLALATRRIAEIRARGHFPIITGGTGLYIRAIMRGLDELPPANPELRAIIASRSLESLQRQFLELDPKGFESIDSKNPRRLIRAIEVCLLTGKPFSSFREKWRAPTAKYGGIVCERPKAELHERIRERTEQMFRNGVEDEVRSCGPLGPTASQTLGLHQIKELLRGSINRAECMEAIQLATRQYAKRQMTWLRRETGLAPVALSTFEDEKRLIETLAANSKTQAHS